MCEQIRWGGGWRSLCIKIGYSEPSGAESRDGTSTRAESSRVTYCSIRLADDSGDVILDSDWLPRAEGSRF